MNDSNRQPQGRFGYWRAAALPLMSVAAVALLASSHAYGQGGFTLPSTTTPSTTAQSTTVPSTTAQPVTAQPATAQLSTSQPSTSQPTTAQPSSGRIQPTYTGGWKSVYGRSPNEGSTGATAAQPESNATAPGSATAPGTSARTASSPGQSSARPYPGQANPAQPPYVARQVPGDPPSGAALGPTLQPSQGYVAPNAPSLSGTGLVDPYAPVPPPVAYPQGPRVREADLIINGYPARTGRIILGGAVNSDAGVTGNLTVDERNFDITRWPTSFQDLFSGYAFRGAGQTLRIEAAPGTDFKRYTIQFADPNIFGYKPVSMSVSGFLFDRRFTDWDEERMGGRLAFGYRITPDLSVSFGVSGQNVEISRPRVLGIPQLDSVLGDNDYYSGEVSLKHDTRDTPLQAARGHYFEFKFEEVFGDFDYARFETEYRKYWLLAERADRTGRQTISYSTQLGFSGEETPIFENFFAGGYATLRGFDFRGASPQVAGVDVGGRFQWLNTVEYMFPITADDAFRGVAFVDFGTVEQDVEIDADNFRVAPGAGLRVAIPMLGPAPLAFDFAYPVTKAPTDDRRVFSFYMSLIN